MTDSKLFLDSSVWLGYFLGNIPEAETIIDSAENILFTSIVSIHEVYKRLKALGKTQKQTDNAIRFIEDNSVLVNLNKEIAIIAANYCVEYKLHAINSLIYSSAMAMETIFITADNDFRETPKTKIIEA